MLHVLSQFDYFRLSKYLTTSEVGRFWPYSSQSLRVTRNLLETGREPKYCCRINCSCCTICDSRRVTLVIHRVVLRHGWGNDQEEFTTSETYQWSFVIHIFQILKFTNDKMQINVILLKEITYFLECWLSIFYTELTAPHTPSIIQVYMSLISTFLL